MTDYIDRLERQLIDAAAVPLPTTNVRPGGARGFRLVLLPAVIVLASATIALAATGLLTGSPVRPAVRPVSTVGVGIPAPGGARLLALRAADPDGGIPWGMRIVRTTRGLVCVQIGRVEDGQLGALGIDGAFQNDGRFHPLPADVLPATGNAGLDASCVLAGNTFTHEDKGIDRNAAPSPTATQAPREDLRVISYGLLGAHAREVTYRTRAGIHTAPVAAGSGAYLIVQPLPGHVPSGVGSGSIGAGGATVARPSPIGAVVAITYRFGNSTCVDGAGARGLPACPQPSIRPAPSGAVTDLHQRIRVRLRITAHVIEGAELRFTAPYPVKSARSGYAVQFALGGCHPGGGTVVSPIDRDIGRGSTVTVDLPDVFANACGRSQQLQVTYGPPPALAPFASAPIVVGTVTVTEPPGTHPPRPTDAGP